MLPARDKDQLYRDRSNEFRSHGTSRIKGLFSVFGVKPAYRQPAGTSASRVLNTFGFLEGGQVIDEYFGVWDATLLNPSLPDNWTIETPTTGKYRITHNLDNSNYYVFVTMDGGSPKLFTVTRANDSFDVDIETDSGGVSVNGATFLLINIT